MQTTATTTGTDNHNHNNHNSAVSGRTQSPSYAPAKAPDLKICRTDFQIGLADNDHYYNRHHRRDNNINHLHYNRTRA